jgi:hypothetical protein
MPTHEELMQPRQAANQKIAEQAIQQISNEYQSNVQLAYEAAAAQKWDDAALYAREAKRLEDEARPYVAAAQQQQPQQPQQQQPQQQYTDAERDLLRDYPQIANDPGKWRTALAAANNLIMRGYDRNSGEYVAAIAHACGVLNSDLTESNEVASPNEALRASQSKYGEVTASEYNENARRLAELKKYGFYPMDNK